MMNLDKRLINQIFSLKSLFILSLLAGIFGAYLMVLQADHISRIIARFFFNHEEISAIKPVLFSLLIIIILRCIFNIMSNICSSALSMHVMTGMRERLTKHIFSLGPAITNNQDSGGISSVFLEGIDSLEAYYSQYLPQLIYAVTIPVIIIIYIFPVDIFTALIFLLTAPLIPIFMILIGKTAERLTSKQWTELSRLSSHFLDSLQGIMTLKALNQSQKQSQKLCETSERYRDITMGVLKVTFLSSFILELVATISTAIVAVEIGLRLLYWKIEFQEAFFVLLIAPDFYLPLRLLGQRFHAGMSGVTAAKNIFKILDNTPLTVIYDNQKKHHRIPDEPYGITFQNVSFKYNDRLHAVLEGISFNIKPEQLTALIGVSGSGKTTIGHLLLRFIKPSSGKILINHSDLIDIPINDWRSQIGWVSQRPHLFNYTIAENIKVGNLHATDEQVIDAAKKANLHDFIMTLPDGYNTIIGEQAVRISGGQAQRIALARIFIKNVRLIILDEPTSNLEPENEVILKNLIRSIYRQYTVLMIAHSMITVSEADNIIVLESGKIIGQGVHDELIKNSLPYKKIFYK